MHPDQFSENAPGKLVKSSAGEGGYWYFVPDPLPPKLGYDATLVNALAEAERALGELAGLQHVLQNPALLIRPFLRREAVASSRIEGSQSNLRELLQYEAGRRPEAGGSPEADVREVLNYVHALEYGLERLDALPVCLRLVREVHQRLLAEVRGTQAQPGTFRGIQNWIGPPDCPVRDASYVPPPVPEMEGCLRALESYINGTSDEPELVKLAILHYQFEAIHPFLDGNGRVGRLLIALLTVHWRMLPLPLLYVSPFFEQNRRLYYDRLLAVSTDGAWAEWVRFFLNGVAAQSHDAVSRARQLQELRSRWREGFQHARSSALLLTLVDSLFVSPILTVKQAQETLDVSDMTARAAVAKLVEASVLSEVGAKRRGRMYAAAEVLDVLDR